MTELATVALAQIRLDGGTQPRVAISEDVVREYAEALHTGTALPPLDVFYDGAVYWLADGFHRYHAAMSIGFDTLPCALRFGTRRDAVLFSAGANQEHGLRRTNADKRKAVTTLLQDEEWGQWSAEEIARRCGVSATLAKDMRASLAVTASEKPAVTYTTKHGTKATMHVENIGSGKLDRSKSAVQERRERMRRMAAEGHSSRQIAAALGIGEEGCRRTLRAEGIDVPADAVVKGLRKHDSNRIVERIVMDAQNLTEGTELIDYATLDGDRLGDWIDSLIASKRALDGFIKRLTKEKATHGEAA